MQLQNKIMKAEELPSIDHLNDESLGLIPLMKVMPDVWKNIPYPLLSAIETLRNSSIEH
jgi:hypothetical protein